MLNDTQVLEDYADCIEDVMRYIREHIGEPLDRETLAEVAGFSVPHFHRVFTAHVGESAIS
jgi:AraC family transcriptional regulator